MFGDGLAAQARDQRGATHGRTSLATPKEPGPQAQPRAERRRERVADRDRERVGGVVRRRELGEPEDHLHHPLHLRLVGAAVAADRLLDAGGRVLAAVDSRVGGRDEHGAARLPDGERDAGVGADVRLLERHRIRRVLGDERRHALVDRLQTEDGVLAGGGRPAAVRHLPEAASAFLDDSVPASSSPRVDTYDFHDRKLRTRSDESCSRRDRMCNSSDTAGARARGRSPNQVSRCEDS